MAVAGVCKMLGQDCDVEGGMDEREFTADLDGIPRVSFAHQLSFQVHRSVSCRRLAGQTQVHIVPL